MDDMNTLIIENLQVKAASGVTILDNFNLTLKPGSLHVLMGKNGSGKSTLAYTLMGHPHYQITQGSITYKNQLINALSPDKRAKMGLFLVFQQPYELSGVSIFNFLKESYSAITGKQIPAAEFQTLVHHYMNLLGLQPNMLHRYVNDGFSGGEKKRFEILQLLLLKPSLAILDEPDSGLDIDALKHVVNALHIIRQENPTMTFLLITHYPRMLAALKPDAIHIIKDGAIIKTGDDALAHHLEKKGYDNVLES